MKETPSSVPISTRLERIAKQAREAPTMAFKTIAHHIDIAWLREAYRRTRKDGARGVDGKSAEDYAVDLEGNLESLLDRAKSGTYRAPPVRRVHIPKGTGRETRPIGIPTFEDKLLQRAVTMALEAIYEQDFLDCSYGFRPGRSAHMALEVLQNNAVSTGGGWIIEIDIRKYFDTIDHAHLRRILRQRVLDGVLLRLVDKWLSAGVLEKGAIRHPDMGSPQGGVVSPILANIFLHDVLDTWFEHDVKPRLTGKARLVRYADDAVFLFSERSDADRVMAVLPKRFGKYGLTLHPEKTRMLEFLSPARRTPLRRRPLTRPETFDFLGFTHFWGLSRNRKWLVRRKTAKDRFRRAVTRVTDWCKEHRHDDVRVQWQALVQKLRGHYAYFGIPGNAWRLSRFLDRVTMAWRYWLHHRSQRARMTWGRMSKLLARYPLPAPRVAPLPPRRVANP